MSTVKCFLDMDGVLADFNKAIHIAHNQPDSFANGKNAGVWDLEKIWGITVKEFYAPSNNYEFWYNLEKTPEADRIVALAIKRFGVQNVAILTSPSLDPNCVPAKRYWVSKYYPEFAKDMIFAHGKGFIAGPNKVLLDDRDRNINDFRAEGGVGITVPRPWNSVYKLSHETYETIEEELDAAIYDGNLALQFVGQAKEGCTTQTRTNSSGV